MLTRAEALLLRSEAVFSGDRNNRRAGRTSASANGSSKC